MSVPFLDLEAGYLELRRQIDGAIRTTLESSSFILGKQLSAFEEEFARFIGVRYCIGVGNGLDALRIALLAAGIRDHDEVIVPANTYIATWIAISLVGARPVPVEAFDDTFTIDTNRIEDAITSKTTAIIPVHLYGQSANMEEVRRLASRYGLFVLEDAAQAHGARYLGHRVGSLGDAAAWSFYPSKNLGCFGDGGAVTTNDESLARHIRQYRNYGQSEKNTHEVMGFNSRLDDLQAAVLRIKLQFLDEWNRRRSSTAQELIAGISNPSIILPSVPDWAEPVWHLFVVRSTHRSSLKHHLSTLGIMTQIHYPTPPHLQPAFAFLALHRGCFPRSELLHDEVLSLPIGPHVSNAQTVEIVNAVEAFQPAG